MNFVYQSVGGNDDDFRWFRHLRLLQFRIGKAVRERVEGVGNLVDARRVVRRRAGILRPYCLIPFSAEASDIEEPRMAPAPFGPRFVELD